MQKEINFHLFPDSGGHFGRHGGQFVPETLMSPLEELTREFNLAREDKEFIAEFQDLLKNYVGRPTSLYFAPRFSREVGAKVYLKREDLNHTGAHKINNSLGQALLAKRMGKKRIIAETGAGQHGVATATACALLDLDCEIFMGEEDIRRQSPNVFRMELLGAKVVPVSSGAATLKDAVNEALRDWVTTVENTYYILGSAVGAHPYPEMVRFFQSVIGIEARSQILELESRLPDRIIACVGGGSNAIGLFHAFLNDPGVRITGVEAGGRGTGIGEHAARILDGRTGVLHGTYSYLLQDDQGQVSETHSISAGLDYPLIGPEHASLHDAGRVNYTSATDEEALEAFYNLCRMEGIIPALESSHALAECLKLKGHVDPEEIIIVNLSGRGDKDVEIIRNIQKA